MHKIERFSAHIKRKRECMIVEGDVYVMIGEARLKIYSKDFIQPVFNEPPSAAV